MAIWLRRRSRRSIWLWLSFAFTMVVAAWFVTGYLRQREASLALDAIEWVLVRRDDLKTTLLAGGDLQPIKQTSVSCQVEDITDSDGTMILSLIDNGTIVKKGDELCRLDSSQFEELARQQEIAVSQARALCLGAQLEFETAGIALREYQEGLVTQLTKEFEGRIALGRSDTRRQADRLAWADDMVVKGYLSRGQLFSERQSYARVQHDLRKAEGEFQLFRQFTIPKEIKTLRGQIETAAINYHVEADRLKVEEDRLAHLRKQSELCTIRAPQAGVVVHANKNRWWAPPLQAGNRVYQDQEMFLLPDLTQMEVQTSVHESMAPRLRVGMKADVRIASMADRVFPGRIAEMDLVPTTNWKEWTGSYKHFIVRVRFDKTPPSVLPYMSASVSFDTGWVPDALVIPVGAMSVVAGRQSCYVVGSNGLELRTITTRRATSDLLEVTAGLNEGERVVLRPVDILGIPVESRIGDPGSDPATEQTASPTPMESPARSKAQAS
jgi:HlyD family secretion protein